MGGMDPVLLTLLSMQRQSALDGRPFVMCLDVWFQGFAVSGEVCSPEEYLENQPKPVPELLKAAQDWAAERSVRENAPAQVNYLDEPCWIHLRKVGILFQHSGQRIEPVNGFFRGDLAFMVGWSIRSFSGRIPRIKF